MTHAIAEGFLDEITKIAAEAELVDHEELARAKKVKEQERKDNDPRHVGIYASRPKGKARWWDDEEQRLKKKTESDEESESDDVPDSTGAQEAAY